MNFEEITLKVIIIGSTAVGKSSLVYYFVNSKPSHHLQQTTGVEYSSKVLQTKQAKVKLHLWDTAGQERFKSITKSYYRGSQGAILVFDLTSQSSFEEVKSWYQLAMEICGEKLTGVLVGNKLDLEEKRQVPKKVAEAFANEKGLGYVETSCFDGTNVNLVFETLVHLIIEKVNNKLISKEELQHKQYKMNETEYKTEEKKCCYSY